jgi:hypothetical protein
MRSLIIPFSIWVGVLQLPPSNQHPISLQATAMLFSIAATMSGLTVLVYRLGVWRQEMVNTKHNVGAEVIRSREETTRQFEQVHQRLAAIEGNVSAHNRQLLQIQFRLARLEKGGRERVA